MPAPYITPLPDAPSTSDSPESFNAKAFPWVAALETLTAQINALVDYINNSGGGGMVNPMTTAFDIILGGLGGAPQRLGLGADKQVLMVDGSTCKWATLPAPSFSCAVTETGVYFMDGSTQVMQAAVALRANIQMDSVVGYLHIYNTSLLDYGTHVAQYVLNGAMPVGYRPSSVAAFAGVCSEGPDPAMFYVVIDSGGDIYIRLHISAGQAQFYSTSIPISFLLPVL